MKKLIAILLSVTFLWLPLEGRRRWIPKIASGSIATFSDNFTRANADPLSNPSSSGGTWTVGPGGFNNVQINSNTVIASAATNDNGCRVLTPTFTGQQRATVTLGSVTELIGPCVRMQSTTDASCYAVITNASATSLSVYKITDTAGTITYVKNGADITISAVAAGDTIGIDASGTSTVTLTIYRNGVSVATRTDSTSPYTGGQPGFWFASSAGFMNPGYSATDF